MVTTAKSSNHHSPPPGDDNSPKFPRKNLPSPWALVVRGGEPDSAGGIHQSLPSSVSSSSSSSLAAEQTPSSEVIPTDNSNTVGVEEDGSDGAEGNANSSKITVWNKSSNGVMETGPVMGAAESWPTLLASTKGSVKSLPPESSSKPVNEGSLSTSQGTMASQSPQKQAPPSTNTNAKPNFAPNYNVPSRQRSIKRVGGGSSIGSGPSQSNFSNTPPPPPPPFPVYQLPAVSYGNIVPGGDPAPRDHYRNNNWDARPLVGGFVPAMNEYQGSSRRGYFGPHPRGDGSYHNSYGGSRRDHQDRGNYVNTRDAFVPRMPPRGLLRHPPPSTAAYVAPQPIGPFANPIGFPEFYYCQPVTMEQFTGMQLFTPSPPPTTFFSAAESPLSNMIVHQIEYYFSDTNLVKDEFLRSKMDEQGWVPVTLIADFPRVKSLTTNIQLIVDSLRTSTIVELQGDKLRRSNEWMRWVKSPGRTKQNNLATNFQTTTLEETTKDESLM